MASPISLPAVYRGLAYHVPDDRAENETEGRMDGDTLEAEARQMEEDVKEEADVRDMAREDEDYLREISRLSRFGTGDDFPKPETSSRRYQHNRTESPTQISEDEVECLPVHLPKRTGIRMDRTISISEPIRSFEDKPGIDEGPVQFESAYPAMPKRRKPFEPNKHFEVFRLL